MGSDDEEIGELNEEMKKLMEEMDSEVYGNPNMSGNFEIDEESGVNLDVNLMKNFLESYLSQTGMAGPVSNMLGVMQDPSNQKKKRNK